MQRYAARFDACEINSTFYRPHRASTFARWRDSTPDGFRFAAKVPKAITHEARLANCQPALSAFVGQVAELGEALGPLLVQLPPSLAFDPGVVEAFFEGLRTDFDGQVACEPRHPSWFQACADAMLHAFRVARVAADPARVPDAARPGGWTGLAYWRLHGSPRMYYSAYAPACLEALAAEVFRTEATQAWVVFDNTTSGAAAADALTLRTLLRPGGRRTPLDPYPAVGRDPIELGCSTPKVIAALMGPAMSAQIASTSARRRRQNSPAAAFGSRITLSGF